MSVDKLKSVEKISDLYWLRLREAKECHEKALSIVTTGLHIVKDGWEMRAHRAESAATSLAHCVLHFGDIAISEINIKKMRKVHKAMMCEGIKRILWGLEDIENFFKR